MTRLKQPQPGKASTSVKIRAASIELSYTGEMPEDAAASIAHILCAMTGVLPGVQTLPQGIASGQAAKRAIKKD